MMIFNATREMLEFALSETNRHFDGNVRFRECELDGRTREGGERWKVGLTVRTRDEREQCGECGEQRENPNHFTVAQHMEECCNASRRSWSFHHHRYRRGQSTAGVKRRIAWVLAHDPVWAPPGYITAACWHVFGVFMDALPDSYRRRQVRVRTALGTFTPSMEWRNDPARDPQVGSMMYPARASEQCDCNSDITCPTREEVQRYEPVEVKVGKALREGCEVSVRGSVRHPILSLNAVCRKYKQREPSDMLGLPDKRGGSYRIPAVKNSTEK